MSAEDYLPFDAYDDEQRSDVICKFCGEAELEWEEVRGAHNRKKWVLVNEKGDIHDCRTASASAEEFP